MAVAFEDHDNRDLTHYMEFVRGIHDHYPIGA
jgi:hypothetical protein